jgi:transposase
MANFLSLQAFKNIRETKISDTELILNLESRNASVICTTCNRLTKRIHERINRIIKHNNFEGKIVKINLNQKRFYCNNGHKKKTFVEKIEGISRQRISSVFKKCIIEKLKSSSIKSTGKHFQTSETVVNRCLQGLVLPENTPVDGQYLGVDEHSRNGQVMALTLTNLSSRSLIKLDTENSKTVLAEYLDSIKHLQIPAFCIDMKLMYKVLILETFPTSDVVVDKFHVIKSVNDRLVELAKLLKCKKYWKVLVTGLGRLSEKGRFRLNQLLEDNPVLKKLYTTKERIRELYKKDISKDKATEEYEHILSDLKTVRDLTCKDLLGTLSRWKNEILNYFKHRITNAYTEGIHTKIKHIKRVSYGFRNPKNYVKKMQLAFV